MAKKPENEDLDYETTGHEWDGIKEYNKPLPRWWLWIFYATIVWGIWYTIAYPAWPLIEGATAGYKGWSTRANVADAIAEAEAANAEINSRLASVELTAIQTDPDLNAYASSAGAAVFKTWCAQCHGSGAGRWKTSTILSPTASATRTTPTRAIPRCLHSAKSFRKKRSARLPTM